MNTALVIVGIALIGAGTYLATLNVIAGAVVVAIGTYALHYGDRRESKADVHRTDEKLTEIQQKIASAKELASSPQEAQKIDSIGQEFRAWASNFVRNKERNQLEVERNRLSNIESQLARSEIWRPVLELFTETIRRSVEAYAAETGIRMLVDFPPFPLNLYDKSIRYEGIVAFDSRAKWTIELDRQEMLEELMAFPVLWVSLRRGKEETRLAHLWLANVDDPIHLSLDSGAVPRLVGITGPISVKNYKAGLQLAAQRLVEAQLLSLSI